MKTKLNLTLLIALFASFALASCEKLPDELVGEFELPGATGGKYTIDIVTSAFNNPDSKGEGYVRAYLIDQEGNETLINRANDGDVVHVRASAYENFDFLEWISTDVTIEDTGSDQISFIMPESNVLIEGVFDDLNMPNPTPYALINDSIPTDRALAKNVALRKWKSEQTSQVFVWFDAWSGRRGYGANSMRALPDEVTIIANWGQPKWNLTDWQKADMKYVRDVKGAKIVVTQFSAHLGDGIPDNPAWSHLVNSTSTDESVMRPAIAAYAKALYEMCLADDYDGFDWDFEPDASGQTTTQAPLWRVKEQAGWFLEEMSYYFGNQARKYTSTERQANGIDRGPVPTRDLLFLVDGEVHDSSFSTGVNNTIATTYVDYYVQQAYGVIGKDNCLNRIKSMVAQQQHHITAGRTTLKDVVGKCILTENFENPAYAASGNGIFDMASVKTYESFPVGGFGAYRIGLSYTSTTEVYKGSPFYTHLRKAIDMQYGEGPRE